MEQRVSLITLGVRDLDAAARFYLAMGWSAVENPHGVVAFDLIGQTLALYELDKLAGDIGVAVESLGHGAMTLAHNLRSRDEVAGVMARAEAAGARVLRPASEVFWGGVVGYFADPEGHVWEIAWNPHAPLRGDGGFRWTGYAVT